MQVGYITAITGKIPISVHEIHVGATVTCSVSTIMKTFTTSEPLPQHIDRYIPRSYWYQDIIKII